jgi:hypothetical protein
MGTRRGWKASFQRKEINALSYLETFLSGCSLVWKDISLPTHKGGTLTTRVQIPATAPPLLDPKVLKAYLIERKFIKEAHRIKLRLVGCAVVV